MEVESSVDIISSPQNEISNILNKDESLLRKLSDVGKLFKSKLGDQLSKIPSINNNSVKNLSPNSLVCFRGMVQDMLDPEFYLGKYSITNKSTNEKSMKTGCYTEVSENLAEEVDFDSASNVTLERQTFVCVPVPGENKWLRDMYASNSPVVENDTVISNNSKKRLHNSMEETNCANIMDTDNSTSPSQMKKLKSENGDVAVNGTHSAKTSGDDERKIYPLPNETGMACFVKMYSGGSDLKLNDVCEFYGVLMTSAHISSDIENEEMPMENELDELPSFSSRLKFPTIHCIFFNKLTSPNQSLIKTTDLYENTVKELASVRNDLIQLLTTVFGGDSTVAEYFLIHLISKTYAVVGTLCVGKLSLNITKFPVNFSCILYDFIQKVVEKSYMLPMTVDNLNKMKYTPKKDYDKNQLVSGVLQLSTGTNLVLDETVMQPGTLDSDGVNNLKAIGNLIQWQNVEYNFTFSKLDMKTDVNVLIFSEGRSMLKCDCQLPLVTEKMDADQAKSSVENIDPTLLEKFRIYLSCIRNLEFNLTEEVSKALEEDFVEMRKKDPTIMTAESFSILLTTARYMALSYGHNTLDSQLWTRAKDLDAERRKRST